MNDELGKNNKNKRKRYLIGFIFYVIFLLCQFSNNLYNHFDENSFKVPFTFAYVYVSSMSLILIVYIINEKWSTGKRTNRMMNLYYHNYNYFYIKTQNKALALKDLERFALKSEHEFSKYFHKISILLMICLFIYVSFHTMSMNHLSVKSENSIVIVTSLVTVLILKKILLRDSNESISNYTNLFAFVINCLGICLMTIYRIPIYFTEAFFPHCFIYSIIAGVSFSFFVCLTKYYSKQYGIKFKVFLIYGFVGLYCLILIPFFLFFIYVYELEGDFFDFKSIYYMLLFIIINSIIRNILAVYSIIYLSPVVFIFGTTLTLPFSVIFDIFEGKINWELNYLFISGFALQLIGFVMHLVHRYKRLKIKNDLEEDLIIKEELNETGSN